MKKILVYVCEHKQEECENYTTFFRDNSDLEIKAFSSAADYAAACSERKPDAVVADVEFKGLKSIYAAFTEESPKLLLTSGRLEEEIGAALRTLPHDGIIYRPYSLSDVADELVSLLSPEREAIKLNGNKNLDERLSNIFIRAGIPPHIKGYQYLRTAVKMVIADPDIGSSITKRLYPEVARYYHTSPSKVERAIRHSIEVAWTRGKIENINAVFGIKIYGKSEKPTNGELIALIADKMVIEMMPEF